MKPYPSINEAVRKITFNELQIKAFILCSTSLFEMQRYSYNVQVESSIFYSTKISVFLGAEGGTDKSTAFAALLYFEKFYSIPRSTLSCTLQ